MIKKVFLLTLLCAGSLLQARHYEEDDYEEYRKDITACAITGGLIGGATSGSVGGAAKGAAWGTIVGTALIQPYNVYTDKKGNKHKVYTNKEGERYYKRRGRRAYLDYDKESGKYYLPD